MKISVSRLKTYKACPRLFYFKYIENLEPVDKPEALVVGSNYHKRLEEMYNGEEDIAEDDFSKERAMAEAYRKYIYPNFKVKSAEDWFEFPLKNGDTLIGITDGIAEDGCLVEHKTVGSEITEEYEFNLQWDEQILAYMLATGSRSVYYTVCRKPTIRQKQSETEEEFYNRMVEWYDEDTDSKIRLLKISRTDEEVERFENELLYFLDHQIPKDENEQEYYRNTCHCHAWGRRCEFSSVCLNYDPEQMYSQFERVERRA